MFIAVLFCCCIAVLFYCWRLESCNVAMLQCCNVTMLVVSPGRLADDHPLSGKPQRGLGIVSGKRSSLIFPSAHRIIILNGSLVLFDIAV